MIDKPWSSMIRALSSTIPCSLANCDVLNSPLWSEQRAWAGDKVHNDVVFYCWSSRGCCVEYLIQAQGILSRSHRHSSMDAWVRKSEFLQPVAMVWAACERGSTNNARGRPMDVVFCWCWSCGLSCVGAITLWSLDLPELNRAQPSGFQRDMIRLEWSALWLSEFITGSHSPPSRLKFCVCRMMGVEVDGPTNLFCWKRYEKRTKDTDNFLVTAARTINT
jgi:hypothetical protein